LSMILIIIFIMAESTTSRRPRVNQIGVVFVI
jgi:hypothetical protein